MLCLQYPSQLGNQGAIHAEAEPDRIRFQIFGKFWKS